jgi:hypothetical protein
MNRLAVVSLFLLSIIFAGCDPYKVDELLLQKEGVSLVIRGEVVFDYDGNRCQMAYNAQRCEYRVMDDDMAHYFVFRCDADLSDVGQEVTADLSYTTSSDIRVEEDLEFKVDQVVPSSGTYWLWCNSRKIGVVVRKI